MKKRLLTLLLVIASVFGVFAIANNNSKDAEAAAPTKLYLTPNSNWKIDNARFAAYFFGNGEKWVSMTKVSDQTDLYEVSVPSGFPNVIFCRMNPSATDNNWNNKWNQTGDLEIPTNGKNHYTVQNGTWDKGGGTWAIYPKPAVVQPWETLSDIYTPFVNGGYYVRNTEINIDMTNEDVKKDLYHAFHAQSFETKRTTYFYPNELWMTNENGVNSGYADDKNGNMYNFSYVDGIKKVNYVTDIKGTEAYYTTLKDITITEAQGWTVSNNVYTSKDATLIKQFLAFTAPCFLNITESNANVFTLSHVTMEKSGSNLVMKLYVAEDTKGFIKDKTTLLSTATISLPQSHRIAASFNGWGSSTDYFKQTDVEGFLFLELELAKGNHEFQYLIGGGDWRGNSGTITDETNGFWEFKNSVNCKLNVAGGTYIFKLDVNASKIEIIKK